MFEDYFDIDSIISYLKQAPLHLGITKKDWLQAQSSAFIDDGTWLDPLKIITTGKY